jgi:DNA polymerase-3 subunit epsilon
VRASLDACGCFPTGRHYPGIAHLLKTVIRGVAEGFAQDAPWREYDIALIDVETTGTDASVDRVIELGIVIGRGGEVVERHNWMINPGMPIPAQSREIHGISDEDVKDAPPFAKVAQEIIAVMKGRIPAAYNATFDKSFVLTELVRANVSLSTPTLTRSYGRVRSNKTSAPARSRTWPRAWASHSRTPTARARTPRLP